MIYWPWSGAVSESECLTLRGWIAVASAWCGQPAHLKRKEGSSKHSGFKVYEPGYIHIDVKYRASNGRQTLAGICLSRLIGANSLGLCPRL